MTTTTPEPRARAGASGTPYLDLPAVQPFAWQPALAFVAHFPATRGEQVVEGDRLIKAWRLAGSTIATRIGAHGDGVRVEFGPGSSVDPAVRRAAADRIRFYLSLDDDLATLAERADRHFAAIERRLHGYHQVKFPSPAELVVWAVLSQRTPMPVARENKRRLSVALNEPVTAFGHALVPFPAVDQLVTLSESDLADLVRNDRKASFLHRTVQRLGETGEPFLRDAPTAEVERFLLALPGIGPWSADFVLIRGLGRMERMPGGSELLSAASTVFGHDVDAAELAMLAERYAPLQGYWAHYLRAGS